MLALLIKVCNTILTMKTKLNIGGKKMNQKVPAINLLLNGKIVQKLQFATHTETFANMVKYSDEGFEVQVCKLNNENGDK